MCSIEKSVDIAGVRTELLSIFLSYQMHPSIGLRPPALSGTELSAPVKSLLAVVKCLGAAPGAAWSGIRSWLGVKKYTDKLCERIKFHSHNIKVYKVTLILPLIKTFIPLDLYFPHLWVTQG